MRRMWINQPSTLQPDHDLHGLDVLAEEEGEGEFVTVYFLAGRATSWTVRKQSLSPGWLSHDTNEFLF